MVSMSGVGVTKETRTERRKTTSALRAHTSNHDTVRSRIGRPPLQVVWCGPAGGYLPPRAFAVADPRLPRTGKTLTVTGGTAGDAGQKGTARTRPLRPSITTIR